MSMNARNDQEVQGEPDPGRAADTRVVPVALFAAFLAVLVAGCVLLCILVLHIAPDETSSETEPLHSPTSAPPVAAPRLQVFPHEDLAAMRSGKQELLQSYGWQDRSTGVVRIPIVRALELAAEHGLKRFGPAARGESTASTREEPIP